MEIQVLDGQLQNESNATKDHTLVRKCDVTQGNNDWVASAGTNASDSEWEVYPQNDWTYLGFHTRYMCFSFRLYRSNSNKL